MSIASRPEKHMRPWQPLWFKAFRQNISVINADEDARAGIRFVRALHKKPDSRKSHVISFLKKSDTTLLKLEAGFGILLPDELRALRSCSDSRTGSVQPR